MTCRCRASNLLALLTCFESDFDDAHECHPETMERMSIISHLLTSEWVFKRQRIVFRFPLFIFRFPTVFSIKIKHFIFIGLSRWRLCCYILIFSSRKIYKNVIKILRSNDWEDDDDDDVDSIGCFINLAQSRYDWSKKFWRILRRHEKTFFGNESWMNRSFIASRALSKTHSIMNASDVNTSRDVNEASQLEISKIIKRAVRFLKASNSSLSRRRFGMTRQLSVLIRNNYQSINSFIRNLFVECEWCVAFPPPSLARLIDFLISSFNTNRHRKKSEFYLSFKTQHHSPFIHEALFLVCWSRRRT